MALTAGQCIALALESAHSPGKAVQALNLYNSILSDLCQERDFAEARGQYVFNFTPTGQPAGGLPFTPQSRYGSGPYLMPADYLRLSGSSGSTGAQRSFIWWLNGVPFPVIPMDLGEFDMMVQQPGLQSYVWLAATDMAAPIDDRILLKTTGDVRAGDIYITNPGSIARLQPGSVIGVAGQGIQPGTVLVDFVAQSTSTPSNISRWGSAVWGVSIWNGPANVGGTVSSPFGGAFEVPGGGAFGTPGGGAIETPGGGGGTGGSAPALILSKPANATVIGASLIFGYPPLIYIWPPPREALQAMIRYQRQMPEVFDTTRIPWFRNDEYLLDSLIGKLCRLNDDARADQLLGGPDVPGSAKNKLSLFLAAIDDKPSHPNRVELDRRYFGRGIGTLKSTKTVGWGR